MTPVLELKNVSVNYGNITALRSVSLQVNAGELVSLIGSNGAGKTTTLKTVSSILHPKSGEIFLQGKPLHLLQPHEVAGMGVAHVPEGRKVFSTLSVEDNLIMGGYLLARREGLKAVTAEMKKAYQLFPRLDERKKQWAGTLSGGEQQMLAIARAMMMRPKVLLLDEPTMGLSPVRINEVFQYIQVLKDAKTTAILLVEQLAYRALGISDRAYVLDQGAIKTTGTGKELLANPDIKKAYLGSKT
ncbi:ABC transporter ATP-binding protein [bacterium]|jgi:branched-chain amino acid transport system ATP-binding protein|nr:ABC transporter ATP-binding protein [bacterium]